MKYTRIYYVVHKARYIGGPYPDKNAAESDIERLRALLAGMGITGIKLQVQQTSSYHLPAVMFSP